MAPSRINQENQMAFRRSLLRAAKRRRLGLESLASQRGRILQLLVAASDMYYWKAENRVKAGRLFS